jgi:hypothetical protein
MMHSTYRKLLPVKVRKMEAKGMRVFPTVNLRLLFVNRLLREGRLNYAVGFINSDPRNPAGLSFTDDCQWVPEGRAYLKDLHGLIH